MTTSIHSFIKDKKKPDYRDTLTTTRLFVKDYTTQYADAITENYKRNHIRQLKYNSLRYSNGGDKSLSDYANQQLKEIEDNNQIAIYYCDQNGNTNDQINPNGSIKNIAGIFNKEKNVLGMMPHPERMIDESLSGEDGSIFFKNLLNNIK